MIENGIIADTSSSTDGESQAVIDARASLASAERELNDINNSITTHHVEMMKDTVCSKKVPT